MKVSYITMRFPASSETFAATDVRALREAGVDVSVHAMRAPQGDPAALLEERRLSGLPVSQGTFWAYMSGVGSCLRRPMLVVRLLVWLFRVSWKRPTQTADHKDQVHQLHAQISLQEYIRNSTVVQLLASLVFVPRSMGILADLEREQPDVVHLFWGHYSCLVGYLVLTTLPQCVVSLFLGAYDLDRNYGGTAWLARRADLVSTHAKWNVPALEALGASRGRIHVAYRGIDPRCFNRERTRKISQRIVAAGRLEEGKGMEDVLLVFREIHDRWPDATLKVLGEGQDRAALERLSRSLGIASAVTFLGHVPQQQVASELSTAEVFLHMSWDEGERLPNVVKEAMASGCLCVVTQTTGIDELVRDGQNGFLVSTRSVKAAAARVDDIFSGRVDVTSLLAAASDHIARYFDVSESMRSYRQHWQDAIGRRRLGPHPSPIAEQSRSTT